MGQLLTLDLATHTGWACGPVGDVADCVYGTIKLKPTGDEIGPFLDQFGLALDALIKEHSVTTVTFESPILRNLTNIVTLRKLYSLAGITELVCHQHYLPVREANLSHIRKHFIGVSRAPKDVPSKNSRAWIKDKTIEQCQRLGWSPKDDNQADALALRSYVIKTRTGREHEALAGELFGGAS